MIDVPPECIFSLRLVIFFWQGLSLLIAGKAAFEASVHLKHCCLSTLLDLVNGEFKSVSVLSSKGTAISSSACFCNSKRIWSSFARGKAHPLAFHHHIFWDHQPSSSSTGQKVEVNEHFKATDLFSCDIFMCYESESVSDWSEDLIKDQSGNPCWSQLIWK